MGPLETERTSLNSTNDSVDPFDYHVLKSSGNKFTKLKIELIHSFYNDDVDENGEDKDIFVGEDEIEYYNGTDELVIIFIQNCVICFENSIVYAFRLCGHQCKSEIYYQKKVKRIY